MSHNPKVADNKTAEAIEKVLEKHKKMWNKPPRDPGRIPVILSLLGEYWARPGYNDLRLGQLIANFASYENGVSDVFYMEDSVLIDNLQKALNTDNA